MPLRTGVEAFRRQSGEIGISLIPWQDVAGSYLYALDPAGNWLFPEGAVIVSRQNGKTEILVPHITTRLRMGRRIMHSAQNRELPREVFGRIADIFLDHYPSELARRPRFANGQEEIRLKNGGVYRIVAPTRGGARGPSNDDVIIDELREMDVWDFIAAAKPTLNASRNPQILYLSNAGDDTSVVLNALRKRKDEDPSLAYLEWSASPERSSDDRAGWVEANPSIGHMPQIEDNLEREHRAHRLSGTLSIFETEHLCRWVNSLDQRLVDDYAWAVAESPEPLGRPKSAYMGVSMDPDGRRASAVIAWRTTDNRLALRQVFEQTGDPIDTDEVGDALRRIADRNRVVSVGYDGLTDRELAKFFRKSQPITGPEFANASARFATAVQSTALRWEDAAAVTDDLVWTTRKPHDQSGSFQAVRADDDRPITASLASIRAVWLASLPPAGLARVY